MSTETANDVIDLLDQEDRAIEALLEEFDSSEAREDHVLRANIGLELRDRLAVQDAAKQELVHAVLDEHGRTELVEQLDGRARERRRLLAQLDDLTRGVSARDVHVGTGEEFDATVRQLKDLLTADLRFERAEVVPALRQELSADELSELGDKVEKVRGRAATHPRADTPLEHEGNPVTKKLKAAVDHVRDIAHDAPHHTETHT